MKTMKKTYGEKTAAFNKLMEEKPGRAVELLVADMKKLGFPSTNRGQVYAMLAKWRKKNKTKAEPADAKVSESHEPIMCQFRIPQAGALIKVTNKKGMVGTLMITEKGVIFARANAKKADQPRMSWDMLEQLGRSGLIPRS